MDAHKYVQYFSAFKREDRLIMSSCVKTEEGLWYLHRPVVVLDPGATLSEIGHAVFRALSESQVGFLEPPSPAELDDTLDCLFKAAGVQTFDHFQESVLHCGVGRDTRGIEITPASIGGTHEVQFLLELRILLETDVSPEQLGAAFLQGFAACSSIYE
jgi:hypothetical protein